MTDLGSLAAFSDAYSFFNTNRSPYMKVISITRQLNSNGIYWSVQYSSTVIPPKESNIKAATTTILQNIGSAYNLKQLSVIRVFSNGTLVDYWLALFHE